MPREQPLQTIEGYTCQNRNQQGLALDGCTGLRHHIKLLGLHSQELQWRPPNIDRK
jgi:hypothetical protein